jgi:MerR family transcriptional regulator, light-induced transcriptional regulator
MTDVNERSFSAGAASDNVSGPRRKPIRQRLAAPIWRFRPAPVAIVQTIKTQIIPKIVLALRALPTTKAAAVGGQGESAIDAFTALTLVADDGAVIAYVDRLLSEGTSVASIYLDWLAPAARKLGEQWETDATDFASVTLGVSRLQRIMRRLDERFFNEVHTADGGESALLTIIPGEQHSFGLSMVAEFFRRAGWNLCTGPFASHHELTSLVQQQWFDIIGFSVSSDRRLDALKQDIRDIRRDSRNPHIGIMLGGPMAMSDPELVTSMGADMMSVDAAAAPQQARALIAQLTRSD